MLAFFFQTWVGMTIIEDSQEIICQSVVALTSAFIVSPYIRGKAEEMVALPSVGCCQIAQQGVQTRPVN